VDLGRTVLRGLSSCICQDKQRRFHRRHYNALQFVLSEHTDGPSLLSRPTDKAEQFKSPISALLIKVFMISHDIGIV